MYSFLFIKSFQEFFAQILERVFVYQDNLIAFLPCERTSLVEKRKQKKTHTKSHFFSCSPKFSQQPNRWKGEIEYEAKGQGAG